MKMPNGQKPEYRPQDDKLHQENLQQIRDRKPGALAAGLIFWNPAFTGEKPTEAAGDDEADNPED